ncbi:MAG: hypothetical protein IKE16_01415 [Solobacterium sp.]|nr:hypothetical protein [Solobacterium sp.]
MRNWHSLYEILTFPITVLFFAVFMLGLGNLITNEAYAAFIHFDNDFVVLLANCLMRTGTFLITNFPFLFLVRLVARKSGSATTMTSAVCGYVSYLVVTMYFSRQDLPSTAYSSILGLSMTTASSATMRGGVHYPLQTGIIATAIVALITLGSFNSSRSRSEYSFFSFISRDTWCVIRTSILSSLAAVAVAWGWPYVIRMLTTAIEYIAKDTTNPVNLMMYGVMDRLLGILNLGTLIRSPFWYSASGGSWISMAGTNIAGDVNIWTSQYEASSLTGMSGRFITPYYVINMFAVPGLLWAMYSLQTDELERRRRRMFYIVTTLMSLFSGCLLPLELSLFLLCPLLFFFHVSFMGILFAVFQSMHVYLGFFYHGTSTMTAMPGTLLEFLSYLQNLNVQNSLIRIAAVGLLSFFIYFFMTRLYFKYLALDLFHTGVKDDVIRGTIESVGGVENIKLIHSGTERLVISLYDSEKLNVNRLKELGAIRVTETKAGYAIGYGSRSTMIRIGITKQMRENIRNT